jgi:putative solute:sodium symporter small subunit
MRFTHIIFTGEDMMAAENKMATQKEQLKAKLEEYWQTNVRLITTLLIIWFVVAYIPPLIINPLNQIVIAGFPFGYYMGSQGSLIVFVVLIFYYASRMNKLDEEYDLLGKKR